MYKEQFPFNLIDLDDSNTIIAEFPTSKNKKSIVYFVHPVLIKSKNKLLIVPFCECDLFTPDISEIEKEMLAFAIENKIKAFDNNCLHIIKTIRGYVYHGFTII